MMLRGGLGAAMKVDEVEADVERMVRTRATRRTL